MVQFLGALSPNEAQDEYQRSLELVTEFEGDMNQDCRGSCILGADIDPNEFGICAPYISPDDRVYKNPNGFYTTIVDIIAGITGTFSPECTTSLLKLQCNSLIIITEIAPLLVSN